MFAFKGRTGRLTYVAAALAVFFAQHLIVLAAFGLSDQALAPDWRFLVTPFGSLAHLQPAPPFIALVGVALMLLAAWVLAVLSFRRAADAGLPGWIAAAAIAPVVQIPAILFLCMASARPEVALSEGAADPSPHFGWWSTSAQGVLAGTAVTVVAVALGALVFGAYGYGMFVVSPFVIGATTAFLANRTDDIGRARTLRLVGGALLLGGVALFFVALEGAVCVVLAFPLALGVAWVGGLCGRAIALAGRKRASNSLMGVALLPLVFASEAALPPSTHFDDTASIEVAASPSTLWRSVIHMDTIETPPALPFRLGVAYPERGEVIGQGVGATRHGYFSTGMATERVTEWAPGRVLAFDILTDPPTLREMSPYRHVHAPHVKGYFRTEHARITLTPLANGHTRLALATTHTLQLEPVLYWLPLTRWVIHENKIRVLTQMARQAEAAPR